MSERGSRANPATSGVAVTPSDSDPIKSCRGIYVGVEGDLNIRFRGNQETVLFTAVPAGSLLPIDADLILATSTTATSIVVLF